MPNGRGVAVRTKMTAKVPIHGRNAECVVEPVFPRKGPRRMERNGGERIATLISHPAAYRRTLLMRRLSFLKEVFLMKKTFAAYRLSMKEFRSVRVITATAMLMAASIVLGYFTLDIGPYLKIGFSTLVNQIAALLFGPVVGAVYNGLLDVIKYFIKPTGPFFPGFTVSAMISGLIYGTAFYRKRISFRRILAAEFAVCLLVNVILGTYWLSLLYGKGFLALLPMRALKNLVQCPVNAVLFRFLAGRMEALGLFRPFRNS